jgi:hypothetical protein
MASTAALPLVSAPFHSSTFLPLATISFDAAFASAAASLRASLRLAGIVSAASMPLASRNLDALVQDVQPLRW